MTKDMPLLISSLQNPKIKNVVKLRQRSHRDEQKLMIIEGYREIKRAINNNHIPTELFICEELFQGENNQALINQCKDKGVTVYECNPVVFRKIAYRDRPDGLLSIAPQLCMSLESLTVPEQALIIVAEAIEKPGNLGTILRSADATGTHAVLVCDKCTDINNPNVVRASTGALFSIPVIETTSEKAIAWLRKNNIQTVAATPHTDKLYTDVDLTKSTAIIVGTEQYGLSNIWMENTDCKVKIPMLGQADSLNVAAATTILLYEAVRQRAIHPDH